MTVMKFTDEEVELLLDAIFAAMEHVGLGSKPYKDLNALADRFENGAVADVS